MGVEKQTNLGPYDKWWSSWAVYLAFGYRFYQKKKMKKISERTVEVFMFYENIIIKCKTGMTERKEKEHNCLLISVSSLKLSITGS